MLGSRPHPDVAELEAESAELYEASPIKRHRSTRAEVRERRASLLKIVSAIRPATVRQVFYQATVHNIVPKIERAYKMVQTDLVQMRRSGVLPYAWLADNTRWQRKPNTFNSVQEALDETARKALWTDAGAYIEVWLEKDALAGVVLPVTALYDVPLMVARGYASLSFLHSAADYINTLDVPVYIYHLGDFDPSGVNAGEAIERTLREMAPAAEIDFERIAVNPDQIAAWGLPTRPTKKSDSRSKGFGDISVELDAIEPNRLRELVELVIQRHLPPDQLATLKAAETSERTLIAGLVGMLKKARMTAGTLTRPVDREKLAQVLGMLGSDFAGERDNAARLAEKLRRESGLTWQQILAPAPARRLDPPREPIVDIDIGGAIRLCLDNRDALLDWEIGFIECLEWQQALPGPVQRQLLSRIARKASAAAARAARPPPPAPARAPKAHKPRRSRRRRAA
jgi:hypothetical protein